MKLASIELPTSAVSSAFAKLVAYGYATAQGSAMLRAAEELFHG